MASLNDLRADVVDFWGKPIGGSSDHGLIAQSAITTVCKPYIAKEDVQAMIALGYVPTEQYCSSTLQAVGRAVFMACKMTAVRDYLVFEQGKTVMELCVVALTLRPQYRNFAHQRANDKIRRASRQMQQSQAEQCQVLQSQSQGGPLAAQYFTEIALAALPTAAIPLV